MPPYVEGFSDSGKTQDGGPPPLKQDLSKLNVEEVEGRTNDPKNSHVRLLPFGPDRIGKAFARADLPDKGITILPGRRKRLAPSYCLQSPEAQSGKRSGNTAGIQTMAEKRNHVISPK